MIIDKEQAKINIFKTKLIYKSMNIKKAVYAALSVACGWAGAVMSYCKPQNSKICYQK